MGTAQPAATSAHATQAGDRMPTTLAGRYNRPVSLGTVIDIGWRAAELLEGAPVVRVLAPMRASIYIVVSGEPLWLCGPADMMHPRAIVLSEPPDPSAFVPGTTLSVPPCAVRPWRPDTPLADARASAALRCGARRLATTAIALGEAAGFGAWLVGRPLTFPLTGAGTLADALAAACAIDNASAAAETAAPLLGLGAGLTPSGDDLVGGAFFARAALARLGTSDAASWRRAAASVREAASGSTNRISAALLIDLLDGHGWSPLHDLARALASDDDALAMSAAYRLTQLGHSSGWDLLAGFVAGAAC
jgi:hypothetical protein